MRTSRSEYQTVRQLKAGAAVPARKIAPPRRSWGAVRALAATAILCVMVPAAIGATNAAGGLVGAVTAVALFTLAGRVAMGGR